MSIANATGMLSKSTAWPDCFDGMSALVHECDIARSRMGVRFRGKSGRATDLAGTTEFDPNLTSAVAHVAAQYCVLAAFHDHAELIFCFASPRVDQMKRREFMSLLGGAAAAWPLPAGAQQGERVRRIGMLIHYSQTDREGQARIAAFLDTVRRLGWTEGRNVRIEYRWSAGDIGREKVFAAELVRATPDTIVVSGWTGLAELKRLTSVIPIVFTQVSDPVGSGLVASLARPGTNISGFQNFEPAMGGKWLGVLKEAAPNMRRAAVLFGSDSVATVAMLHAAEAVAPSLDVQVTAVDVSGGDDIERAIATFASQPDGGLIVTPHSNIPANRGSLILLAARHRLPAVYPFRYYAAEGGLMAYGPDQIDQWRGAATYVDRILRGEKPGDLPVQAPAKYELVINLKTAKVIGLNIPPALPLRADEVIE